MRRLRLPPFTRSLQVGFLVLLGLCTAQLAYWLIDEINYTAGVRARLHQAHEADALAAQRMLHGGWQWIDVQRMYPELVLAPDSSVAVSPAVAASLDAERFHRLNRYAWEGGFFLTVLLAAMAVVYRALREEADLRRRQEHFLDTISHELKSPLASLRLSAETLGLRDPPARRRAELIHRMLADLRRLERMDANVLEASRLESGDTGGASEAIRLATEVGTVLDEVRDQAVESDVQLIIDVPATLGVCADRDRVRTAIRNLLENAVRAAANGGHVTVRALPAGDTVTLEVRDDGIGFSRDDASRLFTKFYRIDGPEPGRLGGTGLGLYLVRRCVEIDAGTVTAASPGRGAGAVFTVNWPAAPA